MNAPQLVQKLWNYCSVLRDDGLSYGDYVEQLTYLLFLKMAHERTQAPWNQPSPIPKGLDWPVLLSKEGDALELRPEVPERRVPREAAELRGAHVERRLEHHPARAHLREQPRDPSRDYLDVVSRAFRARCHVVNSLPNRNASRVLKS
jgi:hypothetical protein